MNFLRRELAPIGDLGWSAIDAMAKDVLAANLSARRFVDVDGPHGIGHAAVVLGRLAMPDKQAGAVHYGIHRVLPLVEMRVPFRLGIWELDNLSRGAADVDLAPLVAACREIAAFEEKAVYEGFKPAGIAGLQAAAKDRKVKAALDTNGIVEAVSAAQARMLKDGVGGPANLVVSPAIWTFLARGVPGGTLRIIVERLIGGRVIPSETVRDALLVAGRGGDMILTVGQDFAIGYHGATATEVELFLTESFTFRVVAPEALVALSLG